MFIFTKIRFILKIYTIRNQLKGNENDPSVETNDPSVETNDPSVETDGKG